LSLAAVLPIVVIVAVVAFIVGAIAVRNRARGGGSR
jgi:hypothetical protein